MKNRWIVSMLCITLLMATTLFAQPAGGPRRGGRGFAPPGRGGPPDGGIERIADDISFTSLQQGIEARSALTAYDQYVRQQTLQARATLLEKMKTILNEQQLSQFKDQLEQIPLIPGAPPQPRGVATSDLVERLMGFDKNQDGKISADELPERMANLMSEGDTNHDGVLDQSEIQKLATQNAVNDPPPNQAGRGRRGGPPPNDL